MDELFETIRAATTPDASVEARAAAADACRALLAALDPQPAAAPPPSPLPPHVEAPIAQLATAIRSVPLDQLLDLAIAKLRAALPAGSDAPTVKPLDFRILPVRRSTP